MIMLSTAPQPTKLSVALIGCGKMGGALLSGWLKRDTVSDVTILDPAALPDSFKGEEIITHVTEASELTGQYDVLMLATKPQIMDTICEGIKDHLNKDTLVLSIAAGKSISYFEGYFGSNQPIIRTMPNTPAAIGKGITVACPNKSVKDAQKKSAENTIGNICVVVVQSVRMFVRLSAWLLKDVVKKIPIMFVKLLLTTAPGIPKK
jgi:pyrroline-5-carboxylate reductase